METPESRADRLIEEFVRDAIGLVDPADMSKAKSKIWQAINEVKEDIARAKIEEES